MTVTRPGQQSINCPVVSPLPSPNITLVSVERISSLQTVARLPAILYSYGKGKHTIPIKNNQLLEKIQGQAGSLTILSETLQKERTMFPFSFLSSSFNQSQSQLQSHMTQGRVVQPGMECV